VTSIPTLPTFLVMGAGAERALETSSPLDRALSVEGGRVLTLEQPFLNDPASFRNTIYYPARNTASVLYDASSPFRPITMERPLQVDCVTIGGLVAVNGVIAQDLPPNIEETFYRENSVNILMVGGLVSDNWDFFQMIAGIFSTSLIVARSLDESKTSLKDLGTTRVLRLGAAHTRYGVLAFQPENNLLRIELFRTQSGKLDSSFGFEV